MRDLLENHTPLLCSIIKVGTSKVGYVKRKKLSNLSLPQVWKLFSIISITLLFFNFLARSIITSSYHLFQHLPALERLSMMRYQLCPDQVIRPLKKTWHFIPFHCQPQTFKVLVQCPVSSYLKLSMPVQLPRLVRAVKSLVVRRNGFLTLQVITSFLR